MKTGLRFFAAIALLVTCGCGGAGYGPTGTVTGKLTMEGSPVSAGYAVSFMQMEKGFLAYGITDAEGKFQVKSWNDGNMPVGKYNVMIAPPVSDEAAANLSAEDRFEQEQVRTAKAKQTLPARNRETTTSGIEYDIAQGSNNFDIDLKSK